MRVWRDNEGKHHHGMRISDPSGARCGLWLLVQRRRRVERHVQVNEDGTVIVSSGSVDIGGSRTSMALMAAETLGVDDSQVRSVVADTSSVGYTNPTGGSRVTFATGMAVVEASKKIVDELRGRAAMIWDVDVDGVVWEDGHASPASSNVGAFPPLSLKEIAPKKALTGGPLTAAASVNAGGQAPGFSTQFCDVEVDPETGKVTILRYVAAQDVGKAIHPSYVEGQIQGGVAQGIGWALNEEYIYDKNGRLDNPGFLDYRVPVAPDIPMIDAVLVEVPNPAHPYGAKGVGEVNIVPPMAAIANAIDSAIHRRLTELPMSPPKIRAALDHTGADD
jgi:CO/xanthine dehydrogenase Mo-binding subunit